MGFLGPNGAGKTTTMQMLCGNLAPSAGEIKINGFDLLDQPNKAKRSLGYLPDTPPLYKRISGLNESINTGSLLKRGRYLFSTFHNTKQKGKRSLFCQLAAPILDL